MFGCCCCVVRCCGCCCCSCIGSTLRLLHICTFVYISILLTEHNCLSVYEIVFMSVCVCVFVLYYKIVIVWRAVCRCRRIRGISAECRVAACWTPHAIIRARGKAPKSLKRERKRPSHFYTDMYYWYNDSEWEWAAGKRGKRNFALGLAMTTTWRAIHSYSPLNWVHWMMCFGLSVSVCLCVCSSFVTGEFTIFYTSIIQLIVHPKCMTSQISCILNSRMFE